MCEFLSWVKNTRVLGVLCQNCQMVKKSCDRIILDQLSARSPILGRVDRISFKHRLWLLPKRRTLTEEQLFLWHQRFFSTRCWSLVLRSLIYSLPTFGLLVWSSFVCLTPTLNIPICQKSDQQDGLFLRKKHRNLFALCLDRRRIPCPIQIMKLNGLRWQVWIGGSLQWVCQLWTPSPNALRGSS